jgi:hypothetical protein
MQEWIQDENSPLYLNFQLGIAQYMHDFENWKLGNNGAIGFTFESFLF